MTSTSVPDRVRVPHIEREIGFDDASALGWQLSEPVRVNTYWSGESAPETRSFEARLLWSDAALHVRFDAAQHEPLVVSDDPRSSEKTIGLWERDVCEIFIAPDRERPNRYFEFEVAPTGEWIDLAIEITADGRVIDLGYTSGMGAMGIVKDKSVVEMIKVPFVALGGPPSTGDIWLGNLFRCVGSVAGRGYLAWRPTRTATPNFHVPSAFGEFEFV
jgi:alpha-galactosidase